MRRLTVEIFQGQKVKDYADLVKSDKQDKTGEIDANVFRYFREILPNSLKGQVVLDIGCGDGHWAKYLSQLGADQIVGFDVSSDMIKAAHKKKKAHKLDTTGLVQADMQAIPVKNNSIDMAISTFSLMYFDQKNLENVLSEISRVLKDCGELYITTNIIESQNLNLLNQIKGQIITMDLGFGDKKLEHIKSLVQTKEQYKKAFAKAGLVLQDEKYFAPEGVVITPDYKYYDEVNLKKVVFKLIKKEEK